MPLWLRSSRRSIPWTFRCSTGGQPPSSNSLWCLCDTPTALQSRMSGFTRLSLTTPDGSPLSLFKNLGLSSLLGSKWASPPQFSRKSLTTAPHPPPNASSRPTSFSTRSLDAASHGQSPYRLSNAAFASGGDTHLTIAPQSPPGAQSALGITNQVRTLRLHVPMPMSKLYCYTMCDNSIMSTYIIVTCHY